MNKFPKDCSSRQIGSSARAIFPYSLNHKNWEFHEQTGPDCGTDMIIEYIEREEFHNYKIECQIKGTTLFEKINKVNWISYALDVKTINYGLSCGCAFLFVLVDIIKENVYYLPLQDYFIAHPEYFNNLEDNKETVNIHIPKDNIISKENDFDLQEIAKSRYIRKSEREILKLRNTI